jgi:farnesyl-diphosphate farnesyltransferase
VRSPIALAYLLARLTDSIADTSTLPVPRRRELLRLLRERIASIHSAPIELAAVVEGQTDPAERRLVTLTERLLEALEHTPPEARDPIRDVLMTIAGGQELDLVRFEHAGPDRVVAIETAADLDDYTYRVAGSVGEFWTRVCRTHLFPHHWVDFKIMQERGVRFGKGLQLVNILRDLPADLRQGRCYVPADSLRAHGLQPTDLLDPGCAPRFRPLYEELVQQAEDHLAAGWLYTDMLPYRLMRLRLACAWPILIGVRTLALLRGANVLDSGQRIKVGRPEVMAIMRRSAMLYILPGRWNRQFERARLRPAT